MAIIRKANLFDWLNVLFMLAFCLTTVFPFWYLLTLSITPGTVSMTQIHLIPPAVTLENFKRVLVSQQIVDGFRNTILRTVLGTTLQTLAAIVTAYPLSKRYLPNRSGYTAFIVFTMFFSGGLIPSYMLIKSLGIMDSVWALVLPGLVPTYNMIIMRNYFMSIPDSMEESARIDGANDIQILFRIILPVSVPIIATVILWQSVGHWNAWFDCMIYISDMRKQVLQVILRRIVLQGTEDAVLLTNPGVDLGFTLNPECIKAATIMVALIPILMVYPFVQKYFISGIMVGSLKG